jgi:hypothetical protein
MPKTDPHEAQFPSKLRQGYVSPGRQGWEENPAILLTYFVTLVFTVLRP